MVSKSTKLHMNTCLDVYEFPTTIKDEFLLILSK